MPAAGRFGRHFKAKAEKDAESTVRCLCKAPVGKRRKCTEASKQVIMPGFALPHCYKTRQVVPHPRVCMRHYKIILLIIPDQAEQVPGHAQERYKGMITAWRWQGACGVEGGAAVNWPT